jgi:hypothetical protein
MAQLSGCSNTRTVYVRVPVAAPGKPDS